MEYVVEQSDQYDIYVGEPADALVRYDGDDREVIFVDGIEPEDRYLGRALWPLVQELQRLGARYNALRLRSSAEDRGRPDR